jgi:hypothetical protein
MRKAIGCMGATEFAPQFRKRYQTNELAVDSTEFGTRGVLRGTKCPHQRPRLRRDKVTWSKNLSQVRSSEVHPARSVVLFSAFLKRKETCDSTPLRWLLPSRLRDKI